jgi:hypothetical protein
MSRLHPSSAAMPRSMCFATLYFDGIQHSADEAKHTRKVLLRFKATGNGYIHSRVALADILVRVDWNIFFVTAQRLSGVYGTAEVSYLRTISAMPVPKNSMEREIF